MPRLPILARCLAALSALLMTAAPLRAVEFEFVGPAPVRNFQPIQLIFLNLPFESAATIQPGSLAFLAQTAETSEIATTQGAWDSTLKFEQNRTLFGLRYGIVEGWEAGLDLPFISRYGGFLDPAIDWVESTFGAVNPERKLFPQDTFAGYSVIHNGTVVFDTGEENFQPGDLVFSVKHAFDVPEPWPRVALRAAIKAPTGNAGAVLGSGKPDFGAGVALDYHPFDRLMLYFNFDAVYPVGPITNANLTLNPMIDESFAAHFALTQRWSIMLHQATYTSPFHGTVRLLDGTVVELGGGLNFAYSPWFGAQVLGIQNMSGVEQSADFTILLSVIYQPWAHPAALPPIAERPPIPLPASDSGAPEPPPAPTPATQLPAVGAATSAAP